MANTLRKTKVNHYDLVSFDLTFPSVKALNKKQVLQDLSKQVANFIGTDQQWLLDNLLEQEKESSSAIGRGISIPHMRLPRLTRPFIVFSKLDQMIEFDAIDSDPVDIVCLVLSPEHEGTKHLQRLSEITRLFQEDHFCQKIREAETREEINDALYDIKMRRYVA